MQENNQLNLDLSEQLFSLLKLGREISSTTNLTQLLEILGNTARDIIGADRCSIFIYNDRSKELWTCMAHGVKEIRVGAKKSVVGKAALSKEVQIVVDAYKDFRFNPEIDKKTGYVTKNIVAVPLLNHKGEAIGVFQALNKKKGIFTNIDAELLILIGNYASVSLENALLYKKIQDSQIKIVHKLSSVAEFKDSETTAHTKRVGSYSKIIAQELGLDNNFCQLIELTAPMHDIGKIGIPENIVLKPASLSNEEFEIMKKHSMIGFEILNEDDDEILKMAAKIARDHHEKFEGGGYPLNKKGEEISIEGRITAVADVFDALTSKRAYKEAWSIEESVLYIQNQRGKQFDPTVIDAFIKKVDEIISIKLSFKD